MILYSAADLIWATKIKSTADHLGVLARPVRSIEMLDARLADAPDDSPVRALLLDLDAPERAMQLLSHLRHPEAPARLRAVRCLAWGPHVARDLLQAARDAGCDEVLTRGAFDHALPDLLLRLDALDTPI